LEFLFYVKLKQKNKGEFAFHFKSTNCNKLVGGKKYINRVSRTEIPLLLSFQNEKHFI